MKRTKGSRIGTEMEEPATRRREGARRTGMVMERWNAELIGTLCIAIITILLLINLSLEKVADTQALVPFIPFILNFVITVLLGGPALGVAGTPQKRGLPSPTTAEGRRLPN
jgi:hypothetical protein